MINRKTVNDGKQVWANDYEGNIAMNPKVTIQIGNCCEVQVERYAQPTGSTPSQPFTQPIAPDFHMFRPSSRRTAFATMLMVNKMR